jgi:hypothetical protein
VEKGPPQRRGGRSEFLCGEEGSDMAEKRIKKAFNEAQLADPSMINDNDDRWLDLFYTTDKGSDDSE